MCKSGKCKAKVEAPAPPAKNRENGASCNNNNQCKSGLCKSGKCKGDIVGDSISGDNDGDNKKNIFKCAFHDDDDQKKLIKYYEDNYGITTKFNNNKEIIYDKVKTLKTLRNKINFDGNITDYNITIKCEVNLDTGKERKEPIITINLTNKNKNKNNKEIINTQKKVSDISNEISEEISVKHSKVVTENYVNYIPQPVKEVFNWIAGRPDVNEKSKLSILPGYKF